MSRADNRELFINCVEYLLGASDLGVINVVARKKMKLGKSYKVKARIRNNESCFSKEAEVGFYLSKTKTLNKTKDILLGTCAVPAIRGKSSKLITLKMEVPAGSKKGAYYVIAEVGAGDSFMEINTQNNQRLKKVKVK